MIERTVTIYVETPVSITVYDYPEEKETRDCPGSDATWDLANIETPFPIGPISKEQWLNKECPDWEQQVDEKVEAARRDEAEYHMELQSEVIMEKRKEHMGRYDYLKEEI